MNILNRNPKKQLLSHMSYKQIIWHIKILRISFDLTVTITQRNDTFDIKLTRWTSRKFGTNTCKYEIYLFPSQNILVYNIQREQSIACTGYM